VSESTTPLNETFGEEEDKGGRGGDCPSSKSLLFSAKLKGGGED
jgi:hypothetical protein